MAHTISHKSGNIEILVIEYFDSCIIQELVTQVFVYKSPQVSLDILMSNLGEILSKTHMPPHCIIAGDFNVDYISCEKFLKYYSWKYFEPAITGVSTNYGTQLGYVFYRGLCPAVHLY